MVLATSAYMGVTVPTITVYGIEPAKDGTLQRFLLGGLGPAPAVGQPPWGDPPGASTCTGKAHAAFASGCGPYLVRMIHAIRFDPNGSSKVDILANMNFSCLNVKDRSVVNCVVWWMSLPLPTTTRSSSVPHRSHFHLPRSGRSPTAHVPRLKEAIARVT